MINGYTRPGRLAVAVSASLQLGVGFAVMHKGIVITSAVLAAATLGLAFAGWMAGPGQWRAGLGIFAFVSGLGLAAVWVLTTAALNLSGRDEWIITCVFVVALALAYGVFKFGPTPGTLLLGLAMGPVLATASMIRQASWGQWQGWSKRSRKPRARKPRARRQVAAGAESEKPKGGRRPLRSPGGD